MRIGYPLRVFCDCSTAHLSCASRAWLDTHAARGEEMIVSTPYGWFLWADEVPAADLPEDLAKIIAYARSLDADYILFDRDAPENDALPVFEWSG